ncbi:MAG: tetratricopeptide repeat protein [Silvibacterium sp.]|nr:tetratricopeptide repeat protein [Silvibacterium sp.]
MPTVLELFISSKMQELRPEREAIFECIRGLDYGDIKLRAWVFEQAAPASGRSIREIYLNALQNSALYIGILWNEYGEWTVDELEKASDWGIERHVYVKDVDSDKRDPRLKVLLDKYGPVPAGITAKWFKTAEELTAAVTQSIETWIGHRLRTRAAGAAAVLARDPDDLIDRPRKLLGREAMLTEVAALLAAGERVLLHGFSGMGKTALAATAAGEWLRGGKGAVLWLKTGSSSEEVLFEALARPLGAWQQMMQTEGDARTTAFRKALRDSEAQLMVLDDCWNGRALFSVLNALPPDMPALVTARQRYAVENMLDIAELKEGDALSLLSEHAKQRLSAAQAGALCKKLAYHPFSLEVAGKALKAQGLSPDELLARIADAPHDLKVPGDFSLKERSSVKELLDASVRVLDDEARKVFFAFGAFFSPQLTVQMLTQYLYNKVIWGDEERSFPAIGGSGSRDEPAVQKALEALEIQGLTQRVSSASHTVLKFVISSGQGATKSPGDTDWKEETELVEYYRIHDLAFSYVRAQSSDAERKNALDICLAFTFFHCEPGPETYAILRSERDNLLGAATFALAQGHFHYVERLAENLFYNSGFLEAEGAYGDALRLLEQAAEAARRRGDTRGYYRQLGNLGKACLGLGLTPLALQHTEAAWRLAKEAGDEEVEMLMLMNLGGIRLQANELKGAYDALVEALEMTRRRGERHRTAVVLSNLGSLFDEVNQPQDACEMYLAAIELGKECEDDQIVSNNQINLGRLLWKAEDYPNAVTYYREGIQTLEHMGNRPGLATGWHGLGYVYRSAGDPAAAIDAWERARTIFASIGNCGAAAACANLIAEIKAGAETS